MLLTLITMCLFASMSGLIIVSEKFGPLDYLKQNTKMRMPIRVFCYCAMVISLLVLARVYGLETALPVWLALLCACAIGSLLIAAIYHSWHLICGFGTALLTMWGASVYVITAIF